MRSARLEKRKHGDVMRWNKGLGFNNAFSAQRYDAVPNDDARTRRTRGESIANAGPYPSLSSIKLCALPRAMLSYFWCRRDTKPGARINPIAREEKQVSTRVEEQRKMQENASRLSCGGCLYGIINLHTYVFSLKDKRSRNNLLCWNRNASIYNYIINFLLLEHHFFLNSDGDSKFSSFCGSRISNQTVCQIMLYNGTLVFEKI